MRRRGAEAARSLLVLLLAAPAPVFGQQHQPVAVSAGVETTRDRFHYRFENDSSFGTVELVPHEFTQTYWGDNQWLVLHARFHAGTHLLETEVAATPQRSTRGDDFDTFFQPSGDIVVAGTTGNVSMRSWRVSQKIGVGHRAGVDWKAGYYYRHDRSVFHPGLKSVTHTLPPSAETSWIYTRETTISQNYGAMLGVAKGWGSRGSSLTLALDGSPLTNARLTTLLPDKYPGRSILFSALVASLSPAVTATVGGRVRLSMSAGYTRTFSYLRSRQFRRSAASGVVEITWLSK